MEKKYKVLIAHSAQQHSFRTAVALKECGSLYKYVTTVYDKEGSLTDKIKKILKGDNLKRANTRKCVSLKDEEVIQFYEGLGLLLLLLQRIDKSKKIYNIIDDLIIYLFHRKVAKYAIKHNVDAVVVYDTLGYRALKILEKKAPNIKRILDMSAPNMIYMDKIFKKDIEKEPIYSEKLKKEINSFKYKNTIKRVEQELVLAQSFLVASEFTRSSLNDKGISNDRIFKCSYGIDLTGYNTVKKNDQNKGKLKCIFIGNVTQKKGITHFLRAVKELDLENYSFNVLGNYEPDANYYKDYKDIVNFCGHVTRDKVIEFCCNSDVIIFPSLADGYGLSVLEALACGTPAICSTNAGISDLIVDFYNGFKILPSSSEEIYNKLIWCEKNRDKLKQMSVNARITAKECTWNKYNRDIEKAINIILR